jgi:hypothetical protein
VYLRASAIDLADNRGTAETHEPIPVVRLATAVRKHNDGPIVQATLQASVSCTLVMKAGEGEEPAATEQQEGGTLPAFCGPPPAEASAGDMQETKPETPEESPEPVVPVYAPPPPPHSPALEAALAQLRFFPRDPYLQYVVLQLARRENCLDEVASAVETAVGVSDHDDVNLYSIFTGALAVQESLQLRTMRARNQTGIETGASAPSPPPDAAPPAPGPEQAPTPRLAEEPSAETTTPEPEVVQPKRLGPTDEEPAGELPPADWGKADGKATRRGPAPAATDQPAVDLSKDIPLTELHGPTIKSHPWRKMLAGRTPDIEPLARMVPRDFYYIRFRSLSRMLEVADLVDLGATHFGNQAWCQAYSQCTGQRLREQLALVTSPALQPIYNKVVQEIALVGSDPFVREGSDVTVLIRFRRAGAGKMWLEASLAAAARAHPNACRSHGESLGVAYEHLATPDRQLCVYVATPAENVHIRSNSLAALQRVLEAIQGKTADGKRVHRLGDSAEFAYIRTLYPCDAAEEDGLIYLSDPFIRRLVGPRLKLTECRRMVCYNHMRMIGHAAMLYRSEHGRPPESLDELRDADCLPRQFRTEASAARQEREQQLLCDLESDDAEVREQAAAELEKLSRPDGALADACCCPDGGTYHLSADGMSGVCTCHGRAHFLTPNLEIPLEQVSGGEAEQYRTFCEDYEQYWRSYFDPIAIRVQVTPERYRLETIVLPLIDNSIYTGLAATLAGAPEELDSLPVPERNIFTVNFRLNKEALVEELEPDAADTDGSANEVEKTPPSATYLAFALASLAQGLGVPEKDLNSLALTQDDILKFVRDGLGNQVGFHIYDAPSRFDFNLPGALGLLGRLPHSSTSSIDRAEMLCELGEVLLLASLGASVNGPVYFSIPVKDAAVVDDFGVKLERIFALAARRTDAMFHELGGTDFYRVPFQAEPGKDMRVFTVRLGPVRLRWYYARIGNGLYIASQPCVLDDILALGKKHAAPKVGACSGLLQMVTPRIIINAEEEEEATVARGLIGGAPLHYDVPAGNNVPSELPAHALLKIRAANWKEELEYNRRGWAENHRQACINNLGPLSSVAQAFTASLGHIDEQELPRVAAQILREAERLHQLHFFCPEGGHYVLSPDGKHITCSIHGSALVPCQPLVAPNRDSFSKCLEQFGGLTTTLTFMKEGLRAVVVIERK